MEDGYKYLLQLFVLLWARFDVPFNPNKCKEMGSCEYSESIKPLETFVTWQLRAGLYSTPQDWGEHSAETELCKIQVFI